MKLGKIIAWLIAIGLVLLVAYALASGLLTDVLNPFTPPPPRGY